MRWRYYFIIFVFSVFYAVLIFNLYIVQLNKNVKAGEVLKSERGNIYFTDKNGGLIPAALNKEYDTIFVVPKETQNQNNDYAEILSPIINFPVEEIEKKLNKQNDLYELLVQKTTSEQVNEIQKLNLKGIYVDKKKLRFYPSGSLASHVLGFVSPATDKEFLKYGNNQVGRYGIELQYNSLLAGALGETEFKDIVLTIDQNVQARAEEILKKTIEKWRAEGGAIIVQESLSGRILAMAGFPDFDPNTYSNFEIKNFLNQTVQSVYEFGSVIKIITMAAGFNSGKIAPDTSYIDTGSVTLNGKTIQNWWKKVYGKATMTDVIENSINTGSVFAERETGHSIFYNYLVNFGFNDLTDIGLPGEVKGDIKNLKNGRDINYATASFGQGISMTAIELINAFSAIANGGILMKPLILADENPKIIRRIISSETVGELTKMMISTVKKNKVADIADYSVAGKTGTAYIPDFKNGGYSDKVINSFIGFLPASAGDSMESPVRKFTILIKLDKPDGEPFATETVAPAFRELARFIINYYNIAPDQISE